MIGSAVTLAAVVWLLGSVQLTPMVFSAPVSPPAVANNIDGQVDLFDLRAPHSVSISISEVEYRKMVDDFQRDGQKTWIRADMVIDGTEIGSVGIRLKGNSTLMSLRGGREGGQRARRDGAMMAAGDGGAPQRADGARADGRSPGPDEAPGPSAGARPSMSSASFEDPSSLPLLLRFDKFVKGRGYQGRQELALRPSVGQGANLNEALALQLIADSHQISQRFSWVSFRINGSEARTRLVIENPCQSYAESLGLGFGALFKSTSSNRFTYLGRDQTLYAEDFSQESGKGSLDRAPLIDLLEFTEHASEEAFAQRLPTMLDVEGFARYIATHDVLGNFDDMSGPGRNFLLWYGQADRRVQILSWDLNLALMSMGGGGGGERGARGAPGPDGAPGGVRGGFAGGEGPPGGGARSGGGEGPPGGVRGGFAGGEDPPGSGARPGGGMRRGNRLKERFLEEPSFAAKVEAAKDELRAQWFDSSLAFDRLAELERSVPRVGALDDAKIRAELDGVVEQIDRLRSQE